MKFRSKYLSFLILFFILPNCSTKQSFTSVSKDLRQIDIISYEDKKVVKTYYQAFNKKIYEWVNVTCVLMQKRIEIKDIDDCSLTKLSKLLIQNKESGDDTKISENSETIISNNSNKENEKSENNQPNLPGQTPDEIQNQDFNECNDFQKC